MDIVWLALAIGMPWLGGGLWVRHAWAAGQPGRLPAIVGYGYFLGLLATIAILWLLEQLSDSWRVGATLIVVTLACIAGAVIPPRRFRRHPANLRSTLTESIRGAARHWRGASVFPRVLVALLLALIALRLGVVLAENVWRPVWAWDAWYFWTYQAQAMLHLGGTDAIIDSADRWLRAPGVAFNIEQRHPSTVSLLQLWPALAAGQWRDAFVHLPWTAALGALLCAVYGQLRVAGLTVLGAAAAVYALISLPVVTTHAALAGYADLWTGAVYALAAMSLYLAYAHRSIGQAGLTMACVAALPTLKYLNVGWACVFLLAAALAPLRPRYIAAAAAILGLGLIAAAMTIGIEIWIPGFGTVTADAESIVLPYGGELVYRSIWGKLGQRMLADASWHLFWYTLPLLAVLGAIAGWRSKAHRALAIVAAGGLAILFIGFSMTEYSRIVIRGTGINRQLLAVTPTLLFWLALLTHALLNAGGERYPASGRHIAHPSRAR